MSPTALTTHALSDVGYLVDVGERRIPHTRITRDLFGFCDLVAVRRRKPKTIGAQATDATNFAARLKKVLASPNLCAVLDADWVVEVWGWRRVTTRERAGKRYSARVARIVRSTSGEALADVRERSWIDTSTARRSGPG